MISSHDNYTIRVTGKETFLSSEIRPSPRGAAGAELVLSKKRGFDTWLETDIDNNETRDRGPDTHLQLVQQNKVINTTMNIELKVTKTTLNTHQTIND